MYLIKCKSWAIKAMWWAFSAAMIGFFAALTFSSTASSTTAPDSVNEYLIFGLSVGAAAGACIPVMISAWFLFLHMISQVSASIKNPPESKE